MRPDELVLALHDVGVTLHPRSDRLHVDAPKGVVSIAMAAALKEHKPLLLGVFRTLDDRARDADWDGLRDWLVDDTTKTFTKPMMAAARRVLPVNNDEWPQGYDRRFRAALRVRGILLAFRGAPAVERTHEEEAEYHDEINEGEFSDDEILLGLNEATGPLSEEEVYAAVLCNRMVCEGTLECVYDDAVRRVGPRYLQAK